MLFTFTLFLALSEDVLAVRLGPMLHFRNGLNPECTFSYGSLLQLTAQETNYTQRARQILTTCPWMTPGDLRIFITLAGTPQTIRSDTFVIERQDDAAHNRFLADIAEAQSCNCAQNTFISRKEGWTFYAMQPKETCLTTPNGKITTPVFCPNSAYFVHTLVSFALIIFLAVRFILELKEWMRS